MLVVNRLTILSAVLMLGAGASAQCVDSIYRIKGTLVDLVSIQAAMSVDIDGNGLADVVVGGSWPYYLAYVQVSPGVFEWAQIDDMGRNPGAIMCPDLNDDGILDIIASNSSDDTVTVRLGTGPLEFGPPQVISVADRPLGLDVGDFDGDGDLDVGVTSGDLDIVHWIRNIGDGQLQIAGLLNTGDEPSQFRLVDFDQDGLLDALVANTGDVPSLDIHFGQGDLTYAPRITLDTDEPRDLLVHDMDDDGDLDIVTAVGEGGRLFVNDGQGQIAEVIELPSAGPILRLELADLDVDTRPDLIMASSNWVSSRLNLGDNAFSDEVISIVGLEPDHIMAGHFDQDAAVDLAIARRNDPVVFIAEQIEDFAFVGQTTIDMSDDVYASAISDVDTDGDQDLLLSTSQFDDSVIQVFLNDGTGVMTGGQVLPSESSVSDIELVDVDGDGDEDLVVTVSNPDVVIYLNHRGTFEFAQAFEVGSNPGATRAADVNGDGWPDLLTTVRNDDEIAVTLNDGAGTFGTPTGVMCGNAPRYIDAGDIDADGDRDVVVATSDGPGVFVNDGTGTFQYVQIEVDDNGTDVMLADFDEDGDDDLVYLTADGVLVFESVNGDMQAPAFYALDDQSPVEAIWTDVNTDGVPDLVLSDVQAEVVTVFFRDGGLDLLQGSIGHYAGGYGAGVVSGLLDEDDVPDLVVSNGHDESATIMLSRCGSTCPADTNGDGRLNVLDFVTFQLLWQKMDDAADCDANAEFNVLDFVCFQQLFVAGCP